MSLKLLTRDQHTKLNFIHSELQQVQIRRNFNCWAFVSQRSAGSEPVFVEYAILRQHHSVFMSMSTKASRMVSNRRISHSVFWKSWPIRRPREFYSNHPPLGTLTASNPSTSKLHGLLECADYPAKNDGSTAKLTRNQKKPFYTCFFSLLAVASEIFLLLYMVMVWPLRTPSASQTPFPALGILDFLTSSLGNRRGSA